MLWSVDDDLSLSLFSLLYLSGFSDGRTSISSASRMVQCASKDVSTDTSSDLAEKRKQGERGNNRASYDD